MQPVVAPASDPSLRKLPRSIQFQGIAVSHSSLSQLAKQARAAEGQRSWYLRQASTQEGQESEAASKQATAWTTACNNACTARPC